jgi:glycosyltransferase involved in cell wall biosynthesis
LVRVISQYGANELDKIVGECNKKKIRLIRLGVEIPAIENEQLKNRFKNWDNEGRIFHIACPAYLLPNKGHVYLIDALFEIKRGGKLLFKCVFYGEGPLKRSLQSQVRRKGLIKEVIFHDTIPNEELLSLYRRSDIDIVVLPSLSEGIPVALMEAMANGVPVIATAVGGVGELLTGEAGVLIESGNPALLAQAIVKLAKDRSYAERTIFNGYDKVRNDFSDKINAKIFLESLTGSTLTA